VKLNDLPVISRVLIVKLTPPFVVSQAPFVDVMPLFVVLTGPFVNPLPPFVTSNAFVRRNDDAVREMAPAARRFDRFVREISRVARKFAPAVRSNFQIGERGVGLVDNFAHFFNGGFQAARGEQTGAGHKRVRADAGAFGGGLVVDAAVHADAVV
jgi:hypothetical protein